MTPASRDLSLRHILPAEAPLVANLAALWAADPILARRVEQIVDRAEREGGPAAPIASQPLCMVTPARSGDPTLAWHGPPSTEGNVTGRGRVVQLHSRYEPREEAQRLAATVDPAGALLLFVHGLGLGYHVEALLNRAGADATAFVFEPRHEVLAATLAARDLSALISAGRVLLLVEVDKAAIFARLSPYMAGASMPVTTLRHEPSIGLAPAAHQAFEQVVGDWLAYAKTCVGTVVVNGRRTAENVARNLPWYLATPSLSRLAGAHAGEPAIIVSAGPSLRKNKHLLSDAAGRCVMIAVQTTLRPLLELGVRPQYVTSLDYHDICTRFFEGLPADLDAELVAEPKATSAIFDLYPGPISMLGNDFAESLLSDRRPGKASLRAGATVAHLAFYLAEHMGCDPIIFVGQDLGFSDGLCYAPGTSYEDVWRPELGRFCTVEMKQWEQIVRDRPILRRVPDHAGRPTYTEERLFTYLQQFERDFAASPARVIDATEGGVLKRGAAPMRLRDALAQFCPRPLGARPPRHPGLSFDALPSAANSLRRRRDEASTVADVARQTLPLLREIRDHLGDQARVNRCIAQVDRMRQRLDSVSGCYDLVTQLTQKTELKRFQDDRAIAAAAAGGEIDDAERQRRQVLRDIENVAGILDAAEALVSLVDDAVARLVDFQAQARRPGRAA